MDKNTALQYIASALNDYANTLAPSVRVAFIKEAQAALKALEAEPPKSE